jgi:hypothetical protein
LSSASRRPSLLSLLSRARSEGLALPAGFWASRSLRRLGTAALLVPCRSAREPAGLAVAATPQVGGGSLSPRARCRGHHLGFRYGLPGRWHMCVPTSVSSGRVESNCFGGSEAGGVGAVCVGGVAGSGGGGVMGCRGGAWMVAACEVVSGRRGGESSKQTWSRSGEVGRTVGFDGGVGAKNRWVRVSVAGVFWQP